MLGLLDDLLPPTRFTAYVVLPSVVPLGKYRSRQSEMCVPEPRPHRSRRE
jgi:hypothetical protein